MEQQPQRGSSQAAGPQASPPARIGVDEFTETVFTAVLRATEARKLPQFPIIYGIIWFPNENLGRGGVIQPGPGPSGG